MIIYGLPEPSIIASQTQSISEFAGAVLTGWLNESWVGFVVLFASDFILLCEIFAAPSSSKIKSFLFT